MRDGAKHYDKIINFRRIKGINYRRVCWCMKLEMFDSVAKIEHRTRTQDNTNAPLIFHSTTTVNGCILMQINVSQQPGRVLLSFPKHSSRNIHFTIFYSISCNFLLLSSSSPPEHRKKGGSKLKNNWKKVWKCKGFYLPEKVMTFRFLGMNSRLRSKHCDTSHKKKSSMDPVSDQAVKLNSSSWSLNRFEFKAA